MISEAQIRTDGYSRVDSKIDSLLSDKIEYPSELNPMFQQLLESARIRIDIVTIVLRKSIVSIPICRRTKFVLYISIYHRLH